jgi:hypothetical protein
MNLNGGSDPTDFKQELSVKKSETEDSSDDVIFEVANVFATYNDPNSPRDGKPSPRGAVSAPNLSKATTQIMDIYNEAFDEADGTGQLAKQKCFARVAVHPTSKKRVLWDLFSFVFVCYDVIVIPMQFFDPPEKTFLQFLANAARFFWTFDIYWSFVTIYMNGDGDLQTEFVQIARNYLTSWFAFDLSIVLVDWLDFISSQGNNTNEAVKSMRVLRVIRLARLMRLSRNSPEISRLMALHVRNESTKVVLGVLRISVVVIAVTHAIACCWYGVSMASSENSWVKEQHLTKEDSLGLRYITCYYWSMVQISGSGIMEPENVVERFFGSIFMTMGFMISVSIVSNLTTLMTRLQLISAQITTQHSVLNRYLVDHEISSDLSSRVQRNAAHALAERKRNTPEHEVELLDIISTPLRVELSFEVSSPTLVPHPFFDCYGRTNPGGMRQICYYAVGSLQLSAGDVVFNSGEVETESGMLFVLKGKLKYKKNFMADCDVHSEMTENVHMLESGNWICEMVLWTQAWAHQGVLRALSECKLLCLNAARFQATAAQFRTAQFHPAQYALSFVQELNYVAMRKDQLSDVAEDMIDTMCLVREVFPLHIQVKNEKLERSKRNSLGRSFSLLGANLPRVRALGSILSNSSNLRINWTRSGSKTPAAGHNKQIVPLGVVNEDAEWSEDEEEDMCGDLACSTSSCSSLERTISKESSDADDGQILT